MGILIGEGRRVFDIASVHEVFADRSDLGLPRADVRVLAVTRNTALDSVVSMRRSHDLDSVTDVDLLVVPGSEVALAGPPAKEVAAVERAAAADVTVASLCTGAFTLAAAGVLDGRAATTHWRYAQDLARKYPTVNVRPRDVYCGGEGVWTSAGVTAGIDLMLHLVRRDWGAHAAETIARSMVTPVHRPGTQAQFADTSMYDKVALGATPTVEQLHLTVMADLTKPWRIEDLAAQCAMSPRTFHRWFAANVGVTPNVWVNDMRVRQAAQLLEQTDLSVAAVSHAVGYNSDDLLRKHFRLRLGTTPTAHASAFRLRGD